MMAGDAPLRVAQVVEALESGGAENLAIEIAGALAERGHESHLVVLRGGGAFEGRLSPKVGYHDLGRPRRDGTQGARVAYFLGTSLRLRELLKSLRVDLIQCHLPKANYLGLAMAVTGVCSVCPTVHNNREFDYGDAAHPLKQRLRRSGYRLMLRRCHGVIAVSNRVRTSLVTELEVSEAGARRIVVVPNGVDVRVAGNPAVRARKRAALGVADDELLLVAVGRLTKQKNHGALIEALGHIQHTGQRWQCIIAGEGELEADLRRLIGDAGQGSRVRLAGLVLDVRSLLDAADVFCLPSLYEGLPLSLLEAMAAGLPTVAFAIDGVQETIGDGQQGILASAGDAGAFGRALTRLLADDELRIRMGRAARDLVSAEYGFPVVVDRLESVYRTALAGRIGGT